MELFAIHCTTCKARLIVKDESAIGDILSCPKCHSMVQVVPPPGWSSPNVAPEPAPQAKPVPARPVPVKEAPTKVALTAPAKSHATPRPVAATSIAGAVAPPALPPRDSACSAAAAVATANPRDWRLIAAGIGGGVLLGALGWLVVWLASPQEVTVAAAPTPTAAPAPATVRRESPAVAATPAPAEDAPPPEAPPQPAVNESPATVTPNTVTPNTVTPNTVTPNTVTPVADAPPAVAPISTPDSEQPSAAADARPELKLDPVAPQPAESTDADPADSLGEAAAADEAPSDNAEPAVDDDLPAVVETSPGEPAPLPVAEIQSRLGVPLARVDFSAVPLGHLAAFLSDVSGARVVIDEPSLARSGKSRKTPVTIKLTGGTALAMLEAAAEQAGLDYRIEPGRITLTARGP